MFIFLASAVLLVVVQNLEFCILFINPFSAKPIFVRKKKKKGKKKNLGNFRSTLIFMLERKILSSFFFSQLIELFHRVMKKKSKIPLNMNYSYPTLNLDLVLMTFVMSCGAERVNRVVVWKD